MRAPHAGHDDIPFERRAAAAHSAAMAKLLRYWFGLWRVAQTRRELLALSDHRLRDLGLSRAQIDALFR